MDDNLDAQREEFESKKKEVSHLRSQLHTLHESKEAAYNELKAVRDQIKQRTSRIRAFKEERDNLTKQVKELKKERDKFNLIMKEKAVVKTEASKKKEEVLGKFEVREKPSGIKEQIRRLETKIETEVMPFTKEQQIRKVIKELKSRYDKVKILDQVWKEVNMASADFSEVRHKAQDFHESMQKTAHDSQAKHEEINKIYEEVKVLQAQEQPLAEKHHELRTQYEEKKKELEAIGGKADELAKVFHEESEKSFRTKVKERTAEVQEKLKKGKKLRMEDILAFQASKD